jgi:predicted CoA-binding protein
MVMKIVVVLGATPKTDRFAWRAMKKLQECGHKVIPVNPAFDQIEGEHCYHSITEVLAPIHTVTLYVGGQKSEPLIDAILAANPKRLIFNPGAENQHLADRAAAAGIEVVCDCTLVMLDQGTF